jgi:hypothetical protein
MKPLYAPIALPLLALAAALAAQFPAQAQTSRYPLTVIPCPTILPPNEIEGKTITCGILTVPENYAEPNGRQIDLTYAVLHSRSLSPAPDPIMDLRGGPGGSTLACIIHEDSQRCGKRPLPLLKGEECAMKEKKSSKWLESQLKLSPNQAFKLL